MKEVITVVELDQFKVTPERIQGTAAGSEGFTLTW